LQTRQLEVYLLPNLTSSTDWKGTTAVVIDVLRATTTITHALASGAKCVIPCLTIDDARDQADQIAGSLLGGEREGKKIIGFDLGNSPGEYTPEMVAGKTILFTTTNGTKAMQTCRQAEQILVAAFVNLSAVCSLLSDCQKVVLVCAGTGGEITREDVLLAGAIVDLLANTPGAEIQLNDQALIAADAWQQAKTGLTATSLVSKLRTSQGGRNVLEIGLEHDIQVAATLDKFDIVPVLNPTTWEIQ